MIFGNGDDIFNCSRAKDISYATTDFRRIVLPDLENETCAPSGGDSFCGMYLQRIPNYVESETRVRHHGTDDGLAGDVTGLEWQRVSLRGGRGQTSLRRDILLAEVGVDDPLRVVRQHLGQSGVR